MKKIYIIYSQTFTLLATIIKLITKEKYSHVSLSLDSSCKSMYSFGRKYYRNPFIGSFVEEGINKGLFKVKKKALIKIYSIDVTENQYKNIQSLIKKYKNNKKIYSYNFIGLIYTNFGMKLNRKNKLYCAEFVYKILSDKKVGILKPTKNPIKLEDILKVNSYSLCYEGKAINYK